MSHVRGAAAQRRGRRLGPLTTQAVSRTLCQMAMWVGMIEFDLRLGEVRSLKDKRSVLRPLIADVRRKFAISVAEVDHLDLHRRAGLGVALVSSERSHVVEVLDAVERLVAYRPEIELLSARRTLAHPAVD